MFITYYMLKKKQATKLKYKKALIKLQSNSSRQIWRQASAKIRATWLVQPNYYNLFDWTIESREVIWYHFTHRVKWYHITSWVSFLFMALSHSVWYPLVICNKNYYSTNDKQVSLKWTGQTQTHILHVLFKCIQLRLIIQPEFTSFNTQKCEVRVWR